MKSKKCVLCGMCRTSCPAFRALGNESVSPRGKALLIENEVFDKILYACTLCGSCKVVCPLELDLELKKVRAKLIKKGIETPSGRKMIENIREHGNPFGKLKPGKVPDELYCC